MVTVKFDPAHGGRWTSLRSASRSGASRSGASGSSSSGSGASGSGAGESGVGQSGVGQSGVGQSGVGQSGVGLSGVGLSGTGQSGGDLGGAGLGAGARDWLWHRVEPARLTARAGDAFADAGGLEECIPTVRGKPDHGEAWSRRWLTLGPEAARVDTDEFTLFRVFRREDDALIAAYRLSAAPGWPFIWAAHALLDLSPSAVLEAPTGTVTRVDGGETTTWPTDLARLGPDDGTATGAILIDCPQVTVADSECLTFTLEAPGQPVSVALWRNLRGWPAGAPYRSIGVEPMLGRVFDRSEAGPGDAAIVPPSGVLEWQLRVTAS